jgi:hypothetical protein
MKVQYTSRLTTLELQRTMKNSEEQEICRRKGSKTEETIDIEILDVNNSKTEIQIEKTCYKCLQSDTSYKTINFSIIKYVTYFYNTIDTTCFLNLDYVLKTN